LVALSVWSLLIALLTTSHARWHHTEIACVTERARKAESKEGPVLFSYNNPLLRASLGPVRTILIPSGGRTSRDLSSRPHL
jgi:hypothetical protein